MGPLVMSQLTNKIASALQNACITADVERVQLLLSLNAETALLPVDIRGRTSLHLAALLGHSQIVRLMMKELSASDALGKEPLEVCKQAQGIMDTVELLQYIVSGCLADLHFHQSLGNEFMRRERYADAKMSYNMSIRLHMQKVGTTRVQDIKPFCTCTKCYRQICGYYYKCTQCGWDFDLCELCMKASLHKHATEVLLRIPSEEFDLNDGVEKEESRKTNCKIMAYSR